MMGTMGTQVACLVNPDPEYLAQAATTVIARLEAEGAVIKSVQATVSADAAGPLHVLWIVYVGPVR